MAKKEKSEKNPSELLNSITTPEDLRRLSVDELPVLCDGVREFLVKELSEHPGHFASSMGAVELTVALHYVFNTPYDRIVWDVGHQAYAHKVLTGRRDKFSTLRQLGGISGFPNPDESEYDTFTAGHASNSISAALGMAVSSLLKNETPRRNVVAVIGDASISGGLAFEGINNAANTRNNLLIILNDNDMSIDRSVGSLGSYLAHLTASRSYNTFRYRTYRLLKKMHLISEKRRGTILRLNNSLKSLLAHQQNIFEGLNVRYFGPFDGHDIKRIVRVLTDIKDMEGPRILHLRTVKGKGYAPAEADPTTWHAPGKFDAQTGKVKAAGAAEAGPLKFQDVFGRTLVELADKNHNIVGITAAMPTGPSMCLMQAAFPKRVFDVGISEGHAVTFAGGLAREGLRPFVAIYSTFLQRGYDHIIHDVAIQRLPVTFCIDRAGIVGEDGATHHGLFDLAYLRSIPGMILAAPSDEHQLRNLLFTAQADNHGPFAIRYPRGKGSIADWKNEMTPVEIGRGQKLADGDDIAILSVGTMRGNVEKALEIVGRQGIKAAHYDMIFVKPIDTRILEEVRQKRCDVITVEDGIVDGGFGSAVAEYLSGSGQRVVRLGIDDKFPPHGTPSQLYSLNGLDADSLAKTIIETIKIAQK
ncbi:MAG: 1-deoxy-D-xylulose-5-phosphate synthase [Muribaculaceae bacterium]|nr:1-deoxy-D-xylulose-5-phosphate synthase [Muribaculaceae bacterium]